jgi:hypothetical protein
MACLGCGRGFHDECEIGCERCHINEGQIIRSLSSGQRGQPLKDPSKITDPYSTGRKRAATMYPIFKTNPCEWRGQKNCGGGTPIVGCIKGLQVDAHHGPVKNPLRNEPGNVHRICKPCHNHWHAVNDSIYNEAEYDKTNHEPEPATNDELLINEMYWKTKR